MKLNKLEVIQNLPTIKPLKPLTFTKTKTVISIFELLRLQSEILYNLKIWHDAVHYPLSDTDRLKFNKHMKIVLDIFKMIDDKNFPSKQEYKYLMKSAEIKSF